MCLEHPKSLLNSQNYNGYHLFRKDTKAGVRTLQSHCMTKVCLNITSINRILKIQQFLPLSFSYLSDCLSTYQCECEPLKVLAQKVCGYADLKDVWTK